MSSSGLPQSGSTLKQQQETLKQLSRMLSSGGADMATRMIPSVIQMLSNEAVLEESAQAQQVAR